MKVKTLFKKIPIFGKVARRIFHQRMPFPGSEEYWIERYESGGSSGDGSCGRLAEFKAQILNGFVRRKRINTIIEYGCGDGNQLKLAEYPSYIGFDISPKAVDLCRDLFARDATKTFKLMKEYAGEKAQLNLSIDVIFHLIEDDIFNEYMNLLFDSAEDFVIIYSSDTDENHPDQSAHIKHRNFTEWVKMRKPEWELRRHIPNLYPFEGDLKTGSYADFYIYQRS